MSKNGACNSCEKKFTKSRIKVNKQFLQQTDQQAKQTSYLANVSIDRTNKLYNQSINKQNKQVLQTDQ